MSTGTAQQGGGVGPSRGLPRTTVEPLEKPQARPLLLPDVKAQQQGNEDPCGGKLGYRAAATQCLPALQVAGSHQGWVLAVTLFVP